MTIAIQMQNTISCLIELNISEGILRISKNLFKSILYGFSFVYKFCGEKQLKSVENEQLNCNLNIF